MSLFDVALFATAFTTLTVIMDPIGTVPIFLGLTSRYSQAKQRRAAIQATSVSFGVILTFAILGGQILRLLSISMEALQLSGGVLLFLVAMELLMGTDSSTPDTGDESVNVALVPLGTPLLAGPARSSPSWWPSGRPERTSDRGSPSSWPWCWRTSSCG